MNERIKRLTIVETPFSIKGSELTYLYEARTEIEDLEARLAEVEKENKKLREEVRQAVAYYETEKPGNSFRRMCLNSARAALGEAKEEGKNPWHPYTENGKMWCSACGTWGDHRSGTCPTIGKNS